jgi:hypothetical protein
MVVISANRQPELTGLPRRDSQNSLNYTDARGTGHVATAVTGPLRNGDQHGEIFTSVPTIGG